MIARHFASLGLKVLLVDGDLRKPSLHVKLAPEQLMRPQQLPYRQCGAARAGPENRQPQSRLHSLRAAAAQRSRSSGRQPDLLAGHAWFGGFRSHRHRLSAAHGDLPTRSCLRARPRRRCSWWARAISARRSSVRRSGALALARIAVVGAVLTKFDAKSCQLWIRLWLWLRLWLRICTATAMAARTTARKSAEVAKLQSRGNMSERSPEALEAALAMLRRPQLAGSPGGLRCQGACRCSWKSRRKSLRL